MIDLHSHILPGLDDGAQSLTEALDMARMAVESGITAMVATPHCADDRTREVQAAADRLRQALHAERIPLRLYMGMEIFGTENTAWLLEEGRLMTLNGSRYPLIEFAFHTSGDAETDILHSVIRAGFRPIVAHPERYGFIQRDPERMNLWKHMGCLFQINRGSLMGRFGYDAQAMAMALVDRGFATVVASDAHSPRARTPWMRDVWPFLSEEFSPVAAKYLLQRNPEMILRNEELAPTEPEWF